jgi:hypothetical protein
LQTWDEADLEARLCRALDIAANTLKYFAHSGYADHELPAYSFGSEKPIAETAMLLYASAAARDRPNVASRIEALARALEPHARSERVLLNIALRPALLHTFAVPHVLLSKLGYEDGAFDEYLKCCITSEARNGQDRQFSSSIERNWILSLWDNYQKDSNCRTNLAESLLNWPVDILGGSRADAYALTHLLFFYTDFGLKSPRLPRRRSSILEETSSLLAKYVDVGDYDLAGEILWAWPLLRAVWNPCAAFGFRLLASVEDHVGVLPCGGIDEARLLRLEGEDRARYALGTGYHTALVMGFLCALSLRPGRCPPANISGRLFGKSCLHTLLRHMDDGQVYWPTELFKLQEREQQVLVPFLLDILIARSCKTNDYEGVKMLLSLASEYDIPVSPMCRQASELLQRIMSCAIAIKQRKEDRGAPMSREQSLAAVFGQQNLDAIAT